MSQNEIIRARFLKRRTVLKAATALAAAATFPPNLSHAANEDEFLAVSQVLTDREGLDPAVRTALYQTFVNLDSKFAESVSRLQSFIKDNGATSANIDGLLKAQAPELATVARQIATGWYLGVVGSGHQSKTVTYTNNLANATVADVLTPPSYGYGAVNSWAQKPI